jgi:hypothetical protein
MRPSCLAAGIVLCGIATAQDPTNAPSAVLPVSSTTSTLPPLTLWERAWFYGTATFGISSLFSAAAGAGINQWRDVPPEWRQGASGFGHRFAYHLAGNASSQAMQFGVSRLLHEDTRYIRSGEPGFRHRVKLVIVRTFIARKDNGPGTTFASSVVIGAYGSGFLDNLYYPKSLNSPGQAMLRGTLSISGTMGNNAFQEFWPDVKRKIFHRH